jgi:hypothetical protein
MLDLCSRSVCLPLPGCYLPLASCHYLPSDFAIPSEKGMRTAIGQVNDEGERRRALRIDKRLWWNRAGRMDTRLTPYHLAVALRVDVSRCRVHFAVGPTCRGLRGLVGRRVCRTLQLVEISRGA